VTPNDRNSVTSSKQDLTPLRIALPLILNSLRVVTESDVLPLGSVLGRVIAKDFLAPISVPPFDNSAMDGYAVRSLDLAGSNMLLSVKDRIPAGAIGDKLSQGESARIFTGAQMPQGSDAVVMQENCEFVNHEKGLIRVLQPVSAGENVRSLGNDIRQGSCLFRAGHRIKSTDIGVLASLGVENINVKRKLKVSLLTTGNELQPPGKSLASGKIYDTNIAMLSSMLVGLGCSVTKHHAVADTFAETLKVFEEAAGESDCVISTGGVSVGEEDHVRDVVESLGKIDLWKLALKPGKPFAFGRIKSHDLIPKFFFGLPGNPVSAFVTFGLIVRPSLLAMMGCKAQAPTSFKVATDFERIYVSEREEYLRSRLDSSSEGMVARPLNNQSSGVAVSLSEADGFIVVPSFSKVNYGDRLGFIPMSEFLY
jgi:molybdopterin molybdotransferase